MKLRELPQRKELTESILRDGTISDEDIREARRIIGSIRHIRLSDEPPIDVKCRLDLLVFLAGLRDMAAFGFAEKNNEASLLDAKRILASQGLHCVITGQIRRPPNEALKDVIGELYSVFDSVNEEEDCRYGKLLWVFREPGQEAQVREAIDRRVSAGTLLGYPACCVRSLEETDLRYQRAFALAIVQAAGQNEEAIARALREDLKVEVPGGFNFENTSVTDERFPFVLHVACDACLSSDTSPSARLNQSYAGLTRKFDQGSYEILVQMSRTQVELGRLVRDAESKGLEPENVYGVKFQDVLEQFQKLCARFFDP